MREYLFRGKAHDGQWIVSQAYYQSDSGNIFLKNKSSMWVQVIPESVGQFTGRIDKNGKKLFEGSVVSVVHGIMRRAEVVVYVPEYARYMLKTRDGGLCSWVHRDSMELIGDIYSNPELLDSYNAC